MEPSPIASANLTVLWLASGFGSCLWFVMLGYNAVALVGYLRYKGDDVASGLSKGAWALGFLSFLLGPCSWLGALAAIVLASVERNRIFQDKSTFASAIPCRHAQVNGTFTLVIWGAFLLGALGAWLG